jgi:hypothetical protein
MKFAAVMLLLAGWIILLTAVALLVAPAPRATFVLAGMVVEILGLAILFRSHSVLRREAE